MQWGIRKEDPKDDMNKKIAATAYLINKSTLAKDLADGLIKKMRLDPHQYGTYSIVIDSIRIIIDYDVVPGGLISLSSRITNLETNDEVTSGIKFAEASGDIQLILEKFLGTAYLLRK